MVAADEVPAGAPAAFAGFGGVAAVMDPAASQAEPAHAAVAVQEGLILQAGKAAAEAAGVGGLGFGDALQCQGEAGPGCVLCPAGGLLQQGAGRFLPGDGGLQERFGRSGQGGWRRILRHGAQDGGVLRLLPGREAEGVGQHVQVCRFQRAGGLQAEGVLLPDARQGQGQQVSQGQGWLMG